MKKLYNLEYLHEISGGDPDFVEEMLKDFLENSPASLDELEDYVMSQNWPASYQVAHRFIPSFEFVGAENIRKTLRVLEANVKSEINLEQVPNLLADAKASLQLLIAEIKTDFKF